MSTYSPEQLLQHLEAGGWIFCDQSDEAKNHRYTTVKYDHNNTAHFEQWDEDVHGSEYGTDYKWSTGSPGDIFTMLVELLTHATEITLHPTNEE